jgi:hypothetical protein
MVELSLIRDLVAIFGVIAGFTYYVMTVRNTNRIRRTQLLGLMYTENKEEDWTRWNELMSMEWEDYDDFERKYGSDYNPDSYGKRMLTWTKMNSFGIMLRDGVIDVTTAYDMWDIWPIWTWMKFETIFREQRIRYKMPRFMKWFEYLYTELIKEGKRRGHTIEAPDNYISYVPDIDSNP